MLYAFFLTPMVYEANTKMKMQMARSWNTADPKMKMGEAKKERSIQNLFARFNSGAMTT